MASFEQYWMGYVRAHVTPNEPVFRTGVGRDYAYAGSTARFMNTAFDVYYRGIQAALTWRDIARADAAIAELKDTGREGSGSGINDLEEAFEHLALGGRWRDDKFATYESSAGESDNYKLFPGNVPAPVNIVNFANARAPRARPRCAPRRYSRRNNKQSTCPRPVKWAKTLENPLADRAKAAEDTHAPALQLHSEWDPRFSSTRFYLKRSATKRPHGSRSLQAEHFR